MSPIAPVDSAVDSELRWIVSLTVWDCARRTLAFIGLGIVVGGIIAGVLRHFSGTPLPILIPLAIVGILVLQCRWLLRWHAHNTSTQAIGTALMETGAGALALTTAMWLGSAPLAGSFALGALMWLATMAFTVPTFWVQELRLRHRAVCRQCGQLLIGVKAPQCPECGYVFLPEHELGLSRSELQVESEEDLPAPQKSEASP